MENYWVICFQVLLILQKSTSQYNYQQAYYSNPVQQYFPIQEAEQDYVDEEVDNRRQWNERAKPGDRKKYNGYDNPESEECKCTCTDCDNPEPCCINVCMSQCDHAQSKEQMSPQPQESPGQSSLVFVPYPYPLVVPSLSALKNFSMGPSSTLRSSESTMPETETPSAKSTTPTPLSTTSSLSSTTSTTTAAPSTATPSTNTPTSSIVLSSDQNACDEIKVVGLSGTAKLIKDDDSSATNSRMYPEPVYTRQSHRKHSNTRDAVPLLRRTRPTWMPRFGIVPIPDKLAEKLMSQLREVKDIKSFHKHRYRRMLLKTY